MTADVVGVIIAGFALGLTMLGAIASMNSRMMTKIDARFDRVAADMDARFEKVTKRFDRVDARMDRLEGDMVELKVAVARLEGPQPRLLIRP